ncbi:unnamed protein product [Triticum aestivum]|uniref:Uncharacterized protein n=1 Tax=Triticum aestivum TaxID=4565 RepID=A0A7H4LHG1_WHEAT|nr:unnamed protein product [Triticum aestivum]
MFNSWPASTTSIIFLLSLSVFTQNTHEAAATLRGEQVEVPIRAAKMPGITDLDVVSCSSTSLMGVGHGLHMEHSLCHIKDGLKPLYGSVQSRRSTIFSGTTMYNFEHRPPMLHLRINFSRVKLVLVFQCS